MDVPPLAGTVPGRSTGSEPVEPTTAELARRLDAVEAGLGRLGGRLEALAVSLEASFETAVATEVQAAAAELRHTVSELGRILVRDLGKLPQMLTQHRQAIVAELRAGAGPEPAEVGSRAPVPHPVAPQPRPDDTGSGTGVGTDHGHDVAAGVDSTTGAPPGPDVTDAGTGGDDDRNWRGRPRRHRPA